MTKQKEWINPNLYTGDPNNMGLGDYCHALGDEAGHQICHQAGVPHSVMKNIENGHPIAAVYLDRIAQVLSNAYQRHIQPGDIANIYVINPGRELPAPASDEPA